MSEQEQVAVEEVVDGQESVPAEDAAIKSDGENADSEKKPDDPAKKNNHDERRWQKLVRERAEFKAKADILEKMQFQNQQHPVPEGSGKPIRDQFSSDEAYIDSLTDWKAERKKIEILQEVKQSRTQETVETGWKKQYDEAKTKYADFQDALDSSDVIVPRHMEEAIVTAENGADIAYYLAKHPEEAETISKLSVVACSRAIGAIEARLSGNKPKSAKVSGAPDPITPVGGRATVVKDLEKIPMAEFAAYENERLKKLNRRK